MNEKELDKLAELEWLEEQGRLQILPCKVGDTMWGIRNWRGVKRPESAEVREMYFTEDMELVIVLRHLCRGIYGKQIFSSYEECEKALNRCY